MKGPFLNSLPRGQQQVLRSLETNCSGKSRTGSSNLFPTKTWLECSVSGISLQSVTSMIRRKSWSLAKKKMIGEVPSPLCRTRLIKYSRECLCLRATLMQTEVLVMTTWLSTQIRMTKTSKFRLTSKQRSKILRIIAMTQLQSYPQACFRKMMMIHSHSKIERFYLHSACSFIIYF